jgi:hypothetical protein
VHQGHGKKKQIRSKPNRSQYRSILEAIWYLDRLVELGVYRNNRTAAARMVIYDHCNLLIAVGRLNLPPSAEIEAPPGRPSAPAAAR